MAKIEGEYCISNIGTLFTQEFCRTSSDKITWGGRQKLLSLFHMKHIYRGWMDPTTYPCMISESSRILKTLDRYHLKLSDLLELCGLSKENMHLFMQDSNVKIYISPGKNQGIIHVEVRGPVIGDFNKIVRTIDCQSGTIENVYIRLVQAQRGNGLGRDIFSSQIQSAKKLGAKQIIISGETKRSGHHNLMKGNTLRLKRGCQLQDPKDFERWKSCFTDEFLQKIERCGSVRDLMQCVSQQEKKLLGIEILPHHSLADSFPNHETFLLRKQAILDPKHHACIQKANSLHELLGSEYGSNLWMRIGIQYVSLLYKL